jgi:hypothetical protein
MMAVVFATKMTTSNTTIAADVSARKSAFG